MPNDLAPTSPTLWRRAIAEFFGTGLLVTVVVGSGIAAERLSPGEPGLQLLENSLATALGLTVIILMVGPVSGAHLNPIVSLADWALGSASSGRRRLPSVLGYLVAQLLGAVGGAVLANLMFGTPTRLSTKARVGDGAWIAELVATAGLVLLIFALARTSRTSLVAPAVGAYIGAAYWFASSTAFANPAVTVGRMFSDTFAGIAPASVMPFIGAQLAGGLVGTALVLTLYPRRTEGQQ